MKSVLAAQFWNEEVESSRSLDAVVHTLPSEPPPLGMLQGTHLSRSQQLLMMQRFLWVPCMPSYALDPDSGGGLVLDRVLASSGGSHWWATLTGRVRAQRLFGKDSPQQNQNFGSHSPPTAMQVKNKWQKCASRLLDSSIYVLCLRTRLQLGPRTSLGATSELDSLSGASPNDNGSDPNDRTPWRGRVTLRHKLDHHHVIMEAAWHECFVDREACYWDVPQAVSLDIASARSPAGLRYRIGVHHSVGSPLGCGREQRARRVPSGALPGTRIQAAASVEKSVNLWKRGILEPGRRQSRKPYNILAASPCISLSGICGGLVSAGLKPKSGNDNFQANIDSESSACSQPESSGPVTADLFASLAINAQFGRFQRSLLDYTNLCARIDLGAASAFATSTIYSKFAGATSSNAFESTEGWFPTLAMTLQQQVVGPLRARVDARLGLDPSSPNEWPRMQEITYGLDYSLESLGAVKLCVWYSPTRHEAMAELRILEG